MTYKYAMSGSHRGTVYRVAEDGELVAEAEIDGGNLLQPGDIKAIAKTTVAALNGAAAEPRVVWHPKAVEALRAVNAYWNQGHTWGSWTDELRAVLLHVNEALALVDQAPPAEKVVAYAAWAPDYLAGPFSTPDEAEEYGRERGAIVTCLVKEPSQ